MNRRGVTLVEMLVVVTLMGLLAGITFPAVSSGVESLRLTAAADSIASFLNAALNRAERRQQVIEVTISRKEAELSMRSADASLVRELKLPAGISITAILPESIQGEEEERQIYLFPGGSVPRVGVEIVNRRGAKRRVRVDPISGVPEIERPEAER